MRTLKIALAAVGLAAGLAVALTLSAARAGSADAVAVRGGRALVVGASGRVLRTLVPTGALGPGVVGRAAVSPDGERVAMTVGRPLPGGPDGVVGEVVVADARTAAPLLRTRLGEAFLGDVAWGASGRVAFVKDWYELWTLDPVSGTVRKVADGRAFAPTAGGAAGMLFAPAFAPDGTIVVARVEETFDGEDDALDNLWRVDGSGSAERLTDLRRPADGWRILRSPVVLADGTVLAVHAATDAGGVWEVARVAGGALERLATTAPDTLLAGLRDGKLYALVADPRTGLFRLVRSSSTGSETLLDGLVAFDLPDEAPPAPPSGSERVPRPAPAGEPGLLPRLLDRLVARVEGR
jgi:hypothetical protein